ncbi:MAG: hypothetical protein JWQ73_1733 [Variovorax sp.]|jgi:hypothetical protein|nr:hypothetical protein [Variovorax sp.]
MDRTASAPDDSSMYRRIALLLSPLVMAGLVYSFGFMAVVVCLALVFATLLFSTGDNNQPVAFDRSVDLGCPTTLMGGF